jgi:hypothetical protein
MPQNANSSNDTLIASQPMPADAHAISTRMLGLMDPKSKQEATVSKASEGMGDIFDRIAAGLYNMASMLVGEGEESIRLVEAAVANAEVSVCHNPVQARQSSRRVLGSAALELLAKRSAASLASPAGLAPASVCIEKDDLKAAGLAQEEFNRMIAGPERERVRSWLESLPIWMRTVFVLRAVAGLTAAETAALLKSHGGPQAAGWTTEAVSEVFRQGLCSLASQLIQASATR